MPDEDNKEQSNSSEINKPEMKAELDLSVAKAEVAVSQDNAVIALDKAINISSATLHAGVNTELNHSKLTNIEVGVGAEGTVETAVGSLSANVEAQYSNSDVQYTVDAEFNSDDDSQLQTNVKLHSDLNDTNLTVGIKRPLLNPNNPHGVFDSRQDRKEELIETGNHFSFESRLGYSREEKSLYTENSLMYRINDKNFLNASYTENKTGRTIDVGADLAKIKVDLSNQTTTTEENEEISTYSVNTDIKGVKNQYNAKVSFVNTKTPEQETGEFVKSDMVVVGGGGQWNRTEYGEFQAGFNGAANASLDIKNGSVSGYQISAEGAYNYYGSEHEKTTDYLACISLMIKKVGELKEFTSGCYFDWRPNNCRTIVESKINYTCSSLPELKEQTLIAGVGVFQQVGKNFGDASIFIQSGLEKEWSSSPDKGNCSQIIPFVRMGGDVKVSNRVNMNAETEWSKDKGFNGSIGVCCTF